MLMLLVHRTDNWTSGFSSNKTIFPQFIICTQAVWLDTCVMCKYNTVDVFKQHFIVMIFPYLTCFLQKTTTKCVTPNETMMPYDYFLIGIH
jgi:hypothetical protein